MYAPTRWNTYPRVGDRDPIPAADPHIKATSVQVERLRPHHSATWTGSVIAANTHRGEPSTVTTA